MRSEHFGCSPLDARDALVMRHLFGDEGDSGIHVGGSGRRDRRWNEAENAERTVGRGEVRSPAGLRRVARRENKRQWVLLRTRSDGNAWLGAVRGGIVAAIPSTESGVLRNVNVDLGPEWNGGEYRVDAMSEPVRGVTKRVSHNGSHVVDEDGLRPGIRLV